eukprot:scaffold26_cov117-Cylindrotheca_fusiformis.AAC.2
MAHKPAHESMDTESTTEHREDERTLKCSCQNFNAMAKIVKTLNAPDQVDRLIRWLEGETDDLALKGNKTLSCGKRSRCRYRYGTSFAILNAIRDACRPYLEPPNGSTSHGAGTKSSTETVPAIYEDDFPPLNRKGKVHPAQIAKSHPAASNILIPPKKSKENQTDPAGDVVVGKKKAAKKRIRPQPADSTVPSNSVWGKPSTLLGTYHGNIANLPSQSPLTPVKNAHVTTEFETSAPWTRAGENDTNPKHSIAERSNPLSSALSASMDENVTRETNVTFSHTQSPSCLETGRDALVEAPENHLERLVEVYVTLMRNMLVPSTPLELHLLLRLLAIDISSVRRENLVESSSTISFFQPIFSTPERCSKFANLALSNLKQLLANLGFPLISSLLRCGPFLKNCPELATDLNMILEERTRQGIMTPEDTIGTHAIFSLPFEEVRDSRHNYRSQAEMAVYKNREQSRDAFLYQLRSYMNEKGKGFQAQDMEGATEKLREEARKLMSSLFTVNMPWFAQFFCDLLSQVGLSPVEETDEELLNITDKAKLQRLHKRFSSRNPNANKSSKKLILSKTKEAASLSPLAEAKLEFPGYQEFFFIFLHSADNYNMGIHLKNRLVATILDLSSNHSTSQLEKRMMNLQLLARFLGFLVFSPNWHDAALDLGKLNRDLGLMTLSNGLHQLESIGLPTDQLVSQSWKFGFSVMTIPWITELLKMAKWDSLSLSSKQLRETMSNLRAIQALAVAGDTKRFGPSMELLSFHLESFFNTTIGLPKLTSLPLSNLPMLGEVLTESLDATLMEFSTSAMFASSSHIEDISNLIDHLNSAPIGKSPSKARKLRPSVVSRELSLEDGSQFLDSPHKSLSASNRTSFPRLAWSGSESTKSVGIQKKLEDAFFHQHRDLRDVCDFTVSRVVKNTARHESLTQLIRDYLEEKKICLDSSDKEISKARETALEIANQFLRRNLEKSVRTSLTALGPSDLPSQVMDVAVSLAVSQGMKAGQALLRALVLDECNTFLDDLNCRKKIVLPSKTLSFGANEQGLEDILFSLSAFPSYLSENRPSKWDTEEIARRIKGALESITLFESMHENLPPEASLRKVFAVLFQIDAEASSFFQWCSSLADKKYFAVMPVFLRFEISAAKLTSYGTKNVSELIDCEVLSRLIKVWPETRDAVEQMTVLLKDMLGARILKEPALRDCLNEEVGPRFLQIQHHMHAELF